MNNLDLRNLTVAPPQVFGGIRLVPLLRQSPTRIRLFQHSYNAKGGIVYDKRSTYSSSYMPHGLIMHWQDEEISQAVQGGKLMPEKELEKLLAMDKAQKFGGAALHHRMVRRLDKKTLRMMPRHMAMEGFLSHFFDGPSIFWKEYIQDVFAYGLMSNSTAMFRGDVIDGLADALKMFEIHDNQVGMMLFTGEILANIFVVSHHEDYRKLHHTLISNFFAEELYYATQWHIPFDLQPKQRGDKITNLDDLEKVMKSIKQEWTDFHEMMGGDVLDRPLMTRNIYKADGYKLRYFVTNYRELNLPNYIGETITDEKLNIEYLQCYRLNKNDSKRIYLLDRLAHHQWNIKATAAEFGQSEENFVLRMDNAGFGYMLRDHVLHEARSKKHKRLKKR